MKIVIAPDSFKESMSASQTASAIQHGFQMVFPHADYLKIPVADGGEGTMEAMVEATQGRKMTKKVTGPLGEKIQASYGILGDQKTAVIEIAEACGLEHVPRNQRNPSLTTSYGVGELIDDALQNEVKHITLALGGSATNDGGAGMAQAIGVQFLDKQGMSLGFGGAELSRLETVDASMLLQKMKETQCCFEVACDVNHPLCGRKGASFIFGPQKGATADMVQQLDQALSHYARVVAQSGLPNFSMLEGAGAAGGLGFGAAVFLNAQLKSGFDVVVNAIKLEEKMRDADLVITGEGCIDDQTLHGKTPIGVTKIAQKYHIPVIGLAGSLGQGADILLENGMTAIFSTMPGVLSLEDALQRAYLNTVQAARNIASLLKLNLRNDC